MKSKQFIDLLSLVQLLCTCFCPPLVDGFLLVRSRTGTRAWRQTPIILDLPLTTVHSVSVDESRESRVDNCSFLDAVLKKPTKTKAIILEVSSPELLETRSQQLRKIGVTALATTDPEIAKKLVQEQKTAQGNFPGPCPVLLASCDKDFISCENDVALRVVRSADDVSKFPRILIDSSLPDALDILDTVPPETVVVWRTAAMQRANAELHPPARANAVWLRDAIVGDTEDVEYAQFIIDGLTKKRSKSFQVSGLTGSTNGHFGGVARKTEMTWLRQKNI